MPMQRIGLDAGRTVPVTRQGRVTREAIVRAALAEIAECGYLDARVESITTRAKVGYGTFYKYFAGKRDLVRAAMSEVFADILDAADAQPADPEDVAASVRRSVRARLEAYHRHRQTLRIFESAIGVDHDLATLYNDLQREKVEAYARLLEGGGGYNPSAGALAVSLAVNALIDEAGRRWAGSAGAFTAFPAIHVEELTDVVVAMILPVVDAARSRTGGRAPGIPAP